MSEQLLTSQRRLIRAHTHADEAQCVEQLLAESRLTRNQRDRIVAHGRHLVEGCRADSESAGSLDSFLQEFNLSSKEGVALMCLAEALLRVPDARTADDLIAEKILSGDWAKHRGHSDSLFVNASTWGLMLTGRLVELDHAITTAADSWLKSMINRLSEPVVRLAVRRAMSIMGQQYVLGSNINEALARGREENRDGTRFSFDMLGEGARTMDDSVRYFEAYRSAIRVIGAHEQAGNPCDANGISVKLSALHPRYESLQKVRVMDELLPRIFTLALEAKNFCLGFTIDAEEADRLDLCLDIFEVLARDSTLHGWDGLGFVLQAYNKRATLISNWLVDLARHSGRRVPVRLVKGAYWDTEIKRAQEQGHADYPVYTRKANTDLSYQVCADRLLSAEDAIYPQFATHNACTAAMLLTLAAGREFEFQRLHGMGELLHRQLDQAETPSPVRVYAPVGVQKDLLPYLVRRLLENGANSSFVNRFMDMQLPVTEVVSDVQQEVESSAARRHAQIPLPSNILRALGENRAYAFGIDINNPDTLRGLLCSIETLRSEFRVTGPVVGDETATEYGEPILCPADRNIVVGTCRPATTADAERALQLATSAQPDWDATGGAARAAVLERAADTMEADMARLTGLISLEGGRTLDDSIAEVREAVDFLRYYALQARGQFVKPRRLVGPDGATRDYSLQGRGVFFCVSPWNFPLAIFIGQVAAALAAGNSVVAKPAEQTPLIAAAGVGILHAAGVPMDVLHFLPGSGSLLGPLLCRDARVKGVAFTGSLATAQDIQKNLLVQNCRGGNRELPVLVAETGGQNAMIADSTALPEQLVDDVIRSAFLSAGQRCSALRVLYLQDEIADTVLAMLKGAMRELTLGNPWEPDTDFGPVIDSRARSQLEKHIERMREEAALHYACEVAPHLENGSFVPAHLIELDSIKQLHGEVFGPVLHVIRFGKSNLKNVINEINGTGFGLTLGVHSRMESFAKQVIQHTHAGNNYINRNMVGAIVGVQPFGGQGLSGTGPKAGGPNYLIRFAKQAENSVVSTPADSIPGGEVSNPSISIIDVLDRAHENQPAWDNLGGAARAEILEHAATLLAADQSGLGAAAAIVRYYSAQAREKFRHPFALPGPTGEVNELYLHGRGVILCCTADDSTTAAIASQLAAALAAGNAAIANPVEAQYAKATGIVQVLLRAGVPPGLLGVAPGSSVTDTAMADPRVRAVVWNGNAATAITLQSKLVQRGGALVPVINEPDGPNYLLRFVLEKTVTNNIVATGGNTQLLNLRDKNVN